MYRSVIFCALFIILIGNVYGDSSIPVPPDPGNDPSCQRITNEPDLIVYTCHNTSVAIFTSSMSLCSTDFASLVTDKDVFIRANTEIIIDCSYIHLNSFFGIAPTITIYKGFTMNVSAPQPSTTCNPGDACNSYPIGPQSEGSNGPDGITGQSGANAGSIIFIAEILHQNDSLVVSNPGPNNMNFIAIGGNGQAGGAPAPGLPGATGATGNEDHEGWQAVPSWECDPTCTKFPRTHNCPGGYAEPFTHFGRRQPFEEPTCCCEQSNPKYNGGVGGNGGNSGCPGVGGNSGNGGLIQIYTLVPFDFTGQYSANVNPGKVGVSSNMTAQPGAPGIGGEGGAFYNHHCDHDGIFSYGHCHDSRPTGFRYPNGPPGKSGIQCTAPKTTPHSGKSGSFMNQTINTTEFLSAEGTDAMKRFFMLAKDDLRMGNIETGISKLNLIASLNPDNNPIPPNSTLYGSVNVGSAQKMLDWTIGINRPSINSLNENSIEVSTVMQNIWDEIITIKLKYTSGMNINGFYQNECPHLPPSFYRNLLEEALSLLKEVIDKSSILNSKVQSDDDLVKASKFAETVARQLAVRYREESVQSLEEADQLQRQCSNLLVYILRNESLENEDMIPCQVSLQKAIAAAEEHSFWHNLWKAALSVIPDVANFIPVIGPEISKIKKGVENVWSEKGHILDNIKNKNMINNITNIKDNGEEIYDTGKKIWDAVSKATQYNTDAKPDMIKVGMTDAQYEQMMGTFHTPECSEFKKELDITNALIQSRQSLVGKMTGSYIKWQSDLVQAQASDAVADEASENAIKGWDPTTVRSATITEQIKYNIGNIIYESLNGYKLALQCNVLREFNTPMPDRDPQNIEYALLEIDRSYGKYMDEQSSTTLPFMEIFTQMRFNYNSSFKTFDKTNNYTLNIPVSSMPGRSRVNIKSWSICYSSNTLRNTYIVSVMHTGGFYNVDDDGNLIQFWEKPTKILIKATHCNYSGQSFNTDGTIGVSFSGYRSSVEPVHNTGAFSSPLMEDYKEQKVIGRSPFASWIIDFDEVENPNFNASQVDGLVIIVSGIAGVQRTRKNIMSVFGGPILEPGITSKETLAEMRIIVSSNETSQENYFDDNIIIIGISIGSIFIITIFTLFILKIVRRYRKKNNGLKHYRMQSNSKFINA